MAAFRRYADRTGVFVPIAEPIPVGRKGRFALTLKDGSVMVEGEAEVISSARTPSVLHGRVGMTIRFSDPDPTSKTVLVELEKARLVPKPAAPSVPPRAADVPAAPRAIPPNPGGRIDRSNALAECVAIGDLDALAVVAAQAAKPGARFVVPTIPPVVGARPKAPSTPPFLAGKPGDSGPFRKASDTGTFPKPSDPLRKPPSDTGASTPRTPSDTDPTPLRKPPSDTGGFAKPADPSTVRKPPSDTGGLAKPAGSPPRSADPSPFRRSPPATAGFDNSDGGDASAFRKPPSDPVPARKPTDAGAAFRKPAADPSDAIPQPVEAPFPKADSGAIRKTTDPGVFATSDAPGDSGPARKATDPGVHPAESARFRKPVTKTQAVAIVPPPAPAPPRGSTTRPAALELLQTEPQVSLRDELPTPTTTTTPPAPISDTLTVPPIVTTDAPAGPTSDTVNVPNRGGPLSTTQAAVTLERGFSETMDVLIGDITAGAAPLELDDEVIPPPPPVNRMPISPNDTSGITTIAPPPTLESMVPVPQARVQTPEDLLTTIRTPRPQMDLLTTMRSTAPPMPPIIGTPPAALPELEIGEPTDLTVIPTVEDAQPVAPRRTEMGIAVPPSEPSHVTPARAMATPQVEEATPSGDWTMIPGAQGPTISPREPEPEPKRQERLTGDWSIQIDMDAPDGWSPPSKVEKIVEPQQPTVMPRTSVKAERTREPTPAPPPVFAGPVEPKVQIDPTLIEPLHPMPPDPLSMFAIPTPVPGALMSPATPPLGTLDGLLDDLLPAPGQVVPLQSSPYPMQHSMPSAYPTPHAADSASFFHEHVPRPQDSTSVTDIGRRRRYIVIGISAAIVVAIGIALLVVLGIGGDPPVVTPVDNGSAPASVTPDAATPVVAAPDAAIVDPKPVTALCSVSIKSAPPGAEIMRDSNRDTVLGTTPAKLELPCGTEVKLLVRKKGFVGEKRVVTPAAKSAVIDITFQKNLFVVKVSSTPPGATIQIGSKNVGVTPGTIKLPAFESSTITISKDGYNVESRKIVPKANNSTVHASLTKKRR